MADSTTLLVPLPTPISPTTNHISPQRLKRLSTFQPLGLLNMSTNTEPAMVDAGGDQAAAPARHRLHAPKYGWIHEANKRIMGQTPTEPHQQHENSPTSIKGLPQERSIAKPRPSSAEQRDMEAQIHATRKTVPTSPPTKDGGSDESDSATRVPPSPTDPKAKHKHHAHDGENSDRNSEQGRPRGNPDESKDPNQVEWDGPDDPDNPQNWSQKRKWLLTILASFLTVNVTFASSAPSSATQQLAQEFQIGTVTATLITSLFLAGYCLGPILWSTTSELIGRKVVMSVAMLMYMLFILGQALAKNPETLFVTRFISGVCAAAPLTICGGVIADMWDPVGRGFAMSLFSCAVFIGPVLGPSSEAS